MALIQRVQDILLKPRQTWPTIAQEPASVASIYNGYLIYLAAIPATENPRSATLITIEAK